MDEYKPPVQSLNSLILACVLATLLALLILITAVLPAEYGIDPTGLGKKMGLTTLSAQNKAANQALAITCPKLPSQADQKINQSQKQAAGDANTGLTKAVEGPSKTQWQDLVKITVPADEGLEYKFYLLKGAVLEYSWATDGTELYFDFHGEPKGDTSGYFKSFKESNDNQSSGKLTASFEGAHGWYWENKTRSPVTLLLNTKGSYQILGLIK